MAIACFVVVMDAYAKGYTSDSPRRKARHYYLSAARYEAEGKSAESAELFRKAYESDTTYSEAALQYGLRRGGMLSGDLASEEERANSRRMTGKFIKEYPGDFFPNLLYANVLEQGGETREAIAVIEEMLRHDSGNSDLLQMLAGLYLDVGESEKAISTIDKYGVIEGEDTEYFVRKAGMKVALKDTVGALEVVQQLIDKKPGDPASMAFRARMEAFFGKTEESEKSFELAEKLSPAGGGGAIKVQFAEFYLSKEDSTNYDKKIYEALIADDLDFPMKRELLAYYLQGLVDNNGEWGRGDRLFNVLLRQYPHEPELLSLSSRYSAVKKDYAKALEDIDYALDLDHSKSAYWEQALMYASMADEYEKSETYFQRATESLENPDPEIYEIAGGTALMGNKPERALEIYSYALDKFYPGLKAGEPMDMGVLSKVLKPDNVNILASLYQQIGDVYFKTEDMEKACSSYDNSLYLNDSSPLTLNNYAYYLVKDSPEPSPENLQKADEMSQRAIILAPDNPTYIDTRAWVLFRLGRYEEAKELQLKAIESLSPDADNEAIAEFYHHLGDILFKNNETDAAIESWEKAYKADPANELLRKKIKNKSYYENI